MTPTQPDSPLGYVLLSLAGSAQAGRGLLAGLRLGAGEPAAAIAGLDDEIEPPSLGAQLRELIGHQDTLSQLVLSERLAALLRGQGERLAAEAELRVVAERPIRTASFGFALHVFAREQAQAIKALLAGLPVGARLEDYSEHERVDAEAVGVEVYSPAHDYELKGKGRVAGPVGAVIAARRQLAAQPLVEVGRVELELA